MMLKRNAPKVPRGLSVPTAWLGALGLSCLSLACATTFDERIVAIARLLDEARSFQAEQYAPEELSQAEDLLAQARAEFAAQREKSWFSRHRRRVRELLHESEAAASLARAEATAAVMRARQDATRELTVAHAALDQASEAYWRSPRGKDTRADLQRMRSDLDALLRRLNEAEVALEQGDFLIASRLAVDVERQASTVARTIERATSYRLGELGSDGKGVIQGVLDSPSRVPVVRLGEASAQSREAALHDGRAG